MRRAPSLMLIATLAGSAFGVEFFTVAAKLPFSPYSRPRSGRRASVEFRNLPQSASA
jgi:hypothetical protein